MPLPPAPPPAAPVGAEELARRLQLVTQAAQTPAAGASTPLAEAAVPATGIPGKPAA